MICLFYSAIPYKPINSGFRKQLKIYQYIQEHESKLLHIVLELITLMPSPATHCDSSNVSVTSLICLFFYLLNTVISYVCMIFFYVRGPATPFTTIQRMDNDWKIVITGRGLNVVKGDGVDMCHCTSLDEVFIM